MARAAIRYGHHEVALEILQGLTERVSSEHLHFWLVCLKEVCEAEALLCSEGSNSNIVDRLDSAIVHYNKGIAALKVKVQLDKYCENKFMIFRRLAHLRTTFSSKRNTCEFALNFSSVWCS